jgi:hypothetical protein
MGGFKAFVTCVDIARAPPELAGRWYDRSLIADLPPGVDPCGENGEFHTVVDGPHLSQLIDVVVGGDGFVFADVIPVAAEQTPGRAGPIWCSACSKP